MAALLDWLSSYPASPMCQLLFVIKKRKTEHMVTAPSKETVQIYLIMIIILQCESGNRGGSIRTAT